MNKHIFSLALSLACLLSVGAQQIIDGIAAVVGNEIITQTELKRDFTLSSQQPGQADVSLCEFLNGQLVERLLVNEGKQDTLINADKDEIKKRVDSRLLGAKNQGVTDERMMEIFGVNTLSDLRKEMEILTENQILGQRKQFSVTQGINATPREVSQFYEENKDQLPRVPEEIELSHIAFEPLISKESEYKLITQLKEIKEAILSGDSFSTKAFIYSQDPGSQPNGGLYTKIRRGKFVKEFEEVAFTLKEGEISDPFETEYGWHIVQLEKRRGEEIDVRHILIKAEPTDEELRNTRQLADSIKIEIEKGNISFQDAAREYSIDKFTKFNSGVITDPQSGSSKLIKNDIPIKVSFALIGLNEGEISRSFNDELNENKVVRIIKLNRTIPEHDMNYEVDFDRLKDFTINQKKQEYLLTWTNEKIPFTFLKIDEAYKSCDFELNWLQ